MALVNPKFLTDDALMEMIEQHKSKPYGDLCEAELTNRMTVKPKPDDEFPNISENDARIIRERVESGIRVLADCGKYGLRELKVNKAVTSMAPCCGTTAYTVTITYSASMSASHPLIGGEHENDAAVHYRKQTSWETGESCFTPITPGEPVKFTR